MSEPPEKTVYATSEAASALQPAYPGCTSITIKRWIEKGIIRGYRPGERTRWRIPAAEVHRLLKEAGFE